MILILVLNCCEAYFLIPFIAHLFLDLKLAVEYAVDPESHGNGKTNGRRKGLQFGELLCLRWGWARSSHVDSMESSSFYTENKWEEYQEQQFGKQGQPGRSNMCTWESENLLEWDSDIKKKWGCYDFICFGECISLSYNIKKCGCWQH